MRNFEDNYEVITGNRESFMSELEAHANTQRFVVTLPEFCRLVTAENIEPDEDGVHADTKKNSGLYINTGSEEIALRAFALSALDNICNVGGGFQTDLTKEEYADFYNTYRFPVMNRRGNKEILLFVQDSKVTGVLTKKAFREIPAMDVFTNVNEYMDTYFPDSKFRNGRFTHRIVSGSYDLSAHAADFGAVLQGVQYSPVFNVQTSDCGLSSVTLRPYIRNKTLVLPISPLTVEHRGSGDKISEVIEKLNQCYSLIDKGVSDLQRLDTIRIAHPHTTLLRVMKACKINKKSALTVAEQHKPLWNSAETALELYKAVCETLMLQPEGQTAEQEFRASDDVARAAAVNWEKYDLPGDFSW